MLLEHEVLLTRTLEKSFPFPQILLAIGVFFVVVVSLRLINPAEEFTSLIALSLTHLELFCFFAWSLLWDAYCQRFDATQTVFASSIFL